MEENLLPDEIRKSRVTDLLGQGRFEDARAVLSELCRDDQRDVEIWFMYGAANAHLGRFDEVIATCHKALEIEPDYLPALNNLASALSAAGRHEEAATAFADVLRLAPDNPAVLNNYGRALVLAGRVDEARRVLENAVRSQPFYADAHYNLAALLEGAGEAAEALREYEQAIALKPGFASMVGDRLDKLRERVRGKTQG